MRYSQEAKKRRNADVRASCTSAKPFIPYLFCGEGSRLLSHMCPAFDGCTLTMLFAEGSSGPKSYAGFFYKRHRSSQLIKSIHVTSNLSNLVQERSGSNTTLDCSYANTRGSEKEQLLYTSKVKNTAESGQQCAWNEERGKE